MRALCALLAAVTAAAITPPRIQTRWAATVSKELPWPEYPRPQLVRAEWQNLNGPWDYWGGANAPVSNPAPDTAPAFPAAPESILVPFPAESYLSGIQRLQEVHLWYRRSLKIPAAWAGQRVHLHFGAVDRLATVYVNGMRVGSHSGGYDSFSFDITRSLRDGPNELVVGVHDPTDGAAPLGKQNANPSGIWYTPTSGIWQTVWLEPTPKAHIVRLELTPDVSRHRLEIVVITQGNTGEMVETSASIPGQTFKVGEARGLPGTKFYLSVANMRLWSPDDPFLYNLEVRLTAGQTVVDKVQSYFGMRSLGLRKLGGYLRPSLNGQPLFQLGPLDQGFWPEGIYTAPSEEAMKDDLLQLRARGFNMVRKHVKVEPQLWYYWADKLGMLVWQDMPNFWAKEEAGARRTFVEELRILINQHRNSPAIVAWVPFNEGWGALDRNTLMQTASLVKGRDPSRWVNAHSGVDFEPGDSGNGDFLDIHQYPGPACPPVTPSGAVVAVDRVAILGEFGGHGLKVPNHMWDPDAAQAYAWYPDIDSLTAAYEAIVKDTIPLVWSCGLSGAVYTELTDIEGELNGHLTYDRAVAKMHVARVKAANEALIQAINQMPDEEIPPVPAYVRPASLGLSAHPSSGFSMMHIPVLLALVVLLVVAARKCVYQRAGGPKHHATKV